MLLFLSLTACIFNCDDGFFPLSKNQKLKTYYLRDSTIYILRAHVNHRAGVLRVRGESNDVVQGHWSEASDSRNALVVLLIWKNGADL